MAIKILAVNGSTVIAQDMESDQRFIAGLQLDSKGRVSKVDREEITETQFSAAVSKYGFYLTEPMVVEKIEDVKLDEIETQLPEGQWYL